MSLMLHYIHHFFNLSELLRVNIILVVEGDWHILNLIIRLIKLKSVIISQSRDGFLLVVVLCFQQILILLPFKLL